jgi:hypothetical protein
VDDSAFAPGTPEVELDRIDGVPVHVDGERGRMGDVVLTNDRIVYGEKFGPTGSLIGGLAEAALEARSEKKAGGPRIAATLSDVRGASLTRRRLLPDLYVLTMEDGSRCRTHRKLRKKWDDVIRRLLTERHGMTVVHENADGWTAEPASGLGN